MVFYRRSLLLLGCILSQAGAAPLQPTGPKVFFAEQNRSHHRLNKPTSRSGDLAAALRGGGSGAALHEHLLKQRGGADIDKTSKWSISDIRPIDYFYLGLHVCGMAAVCLLCRNVARTGGRAPKWITSHVSDPYATGLMHLVYFGIGFLLPWILPPGLSHIIFTPPSVALMGTVFPAIESVRAAVSDRSDDDRTWLMYWVIHGIFQYSTEFMDQLALKSVTIHRWWHCFEVLVVVWLILPFTDGATLIYNTIALPYLVPLVSPIKKMADSWIAAIALTSINASYIWWFSVIFMTLPVIIKRYAVMGVGSIFPVCSTIMALTSEQSGSEMRWLTYWPCFSLLNISMIGVEKFIGSFKGLYVAAMAGTLYLMLPMFDGSMLLFRKVLVPLLQQRELLLLRDARNLAAELVKHVPADRQDAIRQGAARAFMPGA